MAGGSGGGAGVDATFAKHVCTNGYQCCGATYSWRGVTSQKLLARLSLDKADEDYAGGE
jgi:hypothetical protein